MPRPRIHDLDLLLDAAEKLAIESGAAAVTVRALSDLTSVSNGAIYHAFGSRAGLVGSAWLRAAQRFLILQSAAVDSVFDAHPAGEASDAVVAAADAPAAFLLKYPQSGRFLLAVRRGELLGSADIPEQIAEDLRALDISITDLLIRLARAVWDRADRGAVAVVRECVVELPGAMLLRGERIPDQPVRERLAAAVRAVLTVPLPPYTPSQTAHK